MTSPNPGDNVGNNQRGIVRQPLPQPFVVAVTDNGANLILNAEVEFTVKKGGGKFLITAFYGICLLLYIIYIMRSSVRGNMRIFNIL